MEDVRDKFISTALGASSSIAGLFSITKCANGACTSCFACAGAGAGILLLVLFNRIKAKRKEEKNGMA